ncbi:MAG: hypothetical protein J3R72DRAFT_496372 [Linnemannia gamsii]|nr:MAG: hypothetical protein J3R72DRAFT_496372 [Linnemannia gamsii]
MGLFDWYPFIRRKGYRPMQLYIPIIGSLMTGHRLFKVLANCYRVICDAYSNKSQEAAHQLVLKRIKQLGHPEDSVLHFLRRPSRHHDLAPNIQRPISRVQDGRPHGSLGAISRTQLTVLGIVSHNGYNKNVCGLGCATNISIKQLRMYQAWSQIPCLTLGSLSRTRTKLDFDASIMVFAGGQQTLIPCQESNLYALTADKIKPILTTVLFIESAMTRDRVFRQKASQKFNRHQLNDRPPPQDKKSIRNRNTTYVALAGTGSSANAREMTEDAVNTQLSQDSTTLDDDSDTSDRQMKVHKPVRVRGSIDEKPELLLLWIQVDGDQRRNAPNIRAD